MNKKRPTIEEREMRPTPKRRKLAAEPAAERIAREQEREDRKPEEGINLCLGRRPVLSSKTTIFSHLSQAS